MFVAKWDAVLAVLLLPGPFVTAGQFGALRAGYGLHLTGIVDIAVYLLLHVAFRHEVGGVEDRDNNVCFAGA